MEVDLRRKLWLVRKEIPKLEKDAQGFKFKYVDLETILDSVIPILDKHEIGFDHSTHVYDGKNALTTTLFLLNGNDTEIFQSTLVIPDKVELAGMNGYQSLGSALTYFRRYSLLVMLGILTGEDVDIAQPKENKKPPTKPDYVEKVKALIKLGRKRSNLENYFEEYKERMSDAEQKAVIELISKVS